jgi:energy-coupling factor transporter ATP-binding protein EcfA2
MKKEQLLEIINNPNIEADIKADAQMQLDKILALESEDENEGVEQDILFAVKEFNKSIEKLANAGVDKEKVEEILTDRFKTLKIGKKNLDSSVLDLIGKTQTVQIVNWQNVAVKTTGKQRKIFDIILSDFEAGNNVYLYGGAGTGKTYIAKEMAQALNYKLVTLNCNQFTSPLEIIGGQTIEGYQEGRLTYAFGNLWNPNEINVNTGKPFSGALLLLDELPKLDPNSAGLLNDGLSSLKDPIKRAENGREIVPEIQNGRGEKIPKKNIFVIATGNSLLNEADVNYEANFKQDLSLQDRFAGSTYELVIDPQFELDGTMSNIKVGDEIASFVFIFNFLFKLRNAIEKNNFTSRAFVSLRLMVSMRDTYIAYRLNEMQGANKIANPKTLQIAVKTFFDLFTEQQRAVLDTEVNTKEFFDLIEQKNKLPLSDLTSEIDKKEAEMLIKNYEEKSKDKIR